MDDDLFTLRHESYQAARDFYQAQGEYYAIRVACKRAERAAALKLARETGTKHKAALEMLLAFFESEDHHEAEKERTRKLLEVLEWELAQLPR